MDKTDIEIKKVFGRTYKDSKIAYKSFEKCRNERGIQHANAILISNPAHFGEVNNIDGVVDILDLAQRLYLNNSGRII